MFHFARRNPSRQRSGFAEKSKPNRSSKRFLSSGAPEATDSRAQRDSRKSSPDPMREGDWPTRPESATRDPKLLSSRRTIVPASRGMQVARIRMIAELKTILRVRASFSRRRNPRTITSTRNAATVDAAKTASHSPAARREAPPDCQRRPAMRSIHDAVPYPSRPWNDAIPRAAAARLAATATACRNGSECKKPQIPEASAAMIAYLNR